MAAASRATKHRSPAACRARTIRCGFVRLQATASLAAAIALSLVAPDAHSQASGDVSRAPAAEVAGDPAAGERLYRDGLGADGRPIRGRAQGDVEISGAQFSCSSCHRRSGYGSSEGGLYVPPIRGDFLYRSSKADRNRIFKELYLEVQPKEFWSKIREPRFRPAYTDETLTEALRTGTDPGGRTLDTTMPRYDLSDRDAADLVAYLKSLDSQDDPAVDGEAVHFATVFTPGIAPEERAAVEGVLEAFVRWINLDIAGDRSTPGFSPLYRSEFLDTYRRWVLHRWELSGPPEAWHEQLDAFHAERPVFAVVGGLVVGPHAPIASFCNRTRTPCVFPITDLPDTRTGEYGYSLYFDRGVELQAEALAHFLTVENDATEIEQFYLETFSGPAAAVAFQRYGRTRGARTVSRGFSSIDALTAAVSSCCRKATDALVVWGIDGSAALASAFDAASLARSAVIGLPFAALTNGTVISTRRLGQVRFAWPYEKPGVLHPREFDVRAWMGSRRIRISHPRLQFQTYFALTMIEHGLEHLLGDFDRDYLIELIEHEAEKNLNIGTHPSLALGPGQRFASKGAYVVRLSANAIEVAAEKGVEPVSEWIIPIGTPAAVH